MTDIGKVLLSVDQLLTDFRKSVGYQHHGTAPYGNPSGHGGSSGHDEGVIADQRESSLRGVEGSTLHQAKPNPHSLRASCSSKTSGLGRILLPCLQPCSPLSARCNDAPTRFAKLITFSVTPDGISCFVVKGPGIDIGFSGGGIGSDLRGTFVLGRDSIANTSGSSGSKTRKLPGFAHLSCLCHSRSSALSA